MNVFPALPSCSCGPSCGSSCGSPAGDTDPNEELLQRVKEVKENIGNSVKTEIASYITQTHAYSAISKLNQILESSGKKELVATWPYVYTYLLPLIAINDKIAFAGKVPSKQELLDRVKAEIEE